MGYRLSHRRRGVITKPKRGRSAHIAGCTHTFGAFWGVGVGRLAVRVQDDVEEGDGGRDAVAQAAFDDCLGPRRLHERGSGRGEAGGAREGEARGREST
jgi:hypothetical protein